jgi:hypothetical protein
VEKMKRMFGILFLFLLLSATVVFAHSEHPEHSSFEQAEALINAEIPCESLSEEQLEMIGDFLMEQHHPGEQHEVMDEMMGGEDSESLRLMHINMAKGLYCGDSNAMSSEMMANFGGNNGMMGNNRGGMMNMMWGAGMMSGYGWFGMAVLWLFYVVVTALIFGIVFWWTKKLVFGKNKR